MNDYIDQHGKVRRRRGSVPTCGVCEQKSATVLMKIVY